MLSRGSLHITHKADKNCHQLSYQKLNRSLRNTLHKTTMKMFEFYSNWCLNFIQTGAIYRQRQLLHAHWLLKTATETSLTKNI